MYCEILFIIYNYKVTDSNNYPTGGWATTFALAVVVVLGARACTRRILKSDAAREEEITVFNSTVIQQLKVGEAKPYKALEVLLYVPRPRPRPRPRCTVLCGASVAHCNAGFFVTRMLVPDSDVLNNVHDILCSVAHKHRDTQTDTHRHARARAHR